MSKHKFGKSFVAGAFLGGLALVNACNKKPHAGLAPDGSAMTPYIRFEYAVYMMPVHRKDPNVVLRSALAAEFPKLKLVNELPPDPKEMAVKARTERNIEKEYAPPSFDSLKYSGESLRDEQKSKLQETREAFILDFVHPKENVWTGLRNADELIEKIARETGGLVWDEETREVYTPEAWHKQRIGEWAGGEPNISKQVTIHLYQNGEFLRAISLGMKKAGLPDIVVEELPESSGRQIGILIDLFAQSLAEGKAFKNSGDFKLDLRAIQNAELRDPQVRSLKANATGVACLTVKDAEPEEGDPDNRLVELVFDRYGGGDKQAQQEAAVGWLFGREDAVTDVAEHSEDLLAESRREKSKLPQLHRDFAAGLAPGEYILVKAPFETTGGGREWMWVEVRNWKGKTIIGVLENQPARVPGLQSGQMVDVHEDELFDYIRHYPDGHEEGNTTGVLIREQGQKESKTGPPTSGGPPVCKE